MSLLSRTLQLGTRAFAHRWLVGAFAVVKNQKNEILLLEHRHREKPWGAPGGLLRWPESPAEGLAREMREEMGWEISPDELSLVTCLKSPKVPLLEMVFVLQSQAPRAEPRLQASEILSCKWFSRDELLQCAGLLERHKNIFLTHLDTTVKP